MKLNKINPNFPPFLVLVLLSLVLIALAYFTKNAFLQNLLSNMAATSLYAIIAIFTYDRVKHFSDRQKTKELREYAESEINPQIMSILVTVSKLIYPKPAHFTLMKELDKVSKVEIKKLIKERQYMGFELFCNSSETTKDIKELLSNNFIRPLLDDDLALLLLKLTNRLKRLFKLFSEQKNLQEIKKDTSDTYTIFGSRDISSYNASYPNRRLLVKNIPGKKGMGVVESAADFSPEIENDILVKYYKVNEASLSNITDTIQEIISLSKTWISRR
ncbi:hypothetical protein HGA88_00585 [Candidatus Roizmanbacteria bacterium]|nr:hypothetical protein [Candidatus Roizmanbacteria bacterium]